MTEDSYRISLTSKEVPLELVKELATIPLQRINAGPSGQSGALLAVSAVVLVSPLMQNSKRPFELSWLREVPMELVKELSTTPLEQSHGGDLGCGRQLSDLEQSSYEGPEGAGKDALQRLGSGVFA